MGRGRFPRPIVFLLEGSMMRNAVGLLLVLLFGCATRGDMRSLQHDVEESQRSLAVLDSLLRDQSEAILRLRATLETKVERTNEQIQRLDSKVVENARRFSVLSQKIDAVRLYGTAQPVSPPGTAKDTLATQPNVTVSVAPERLYETAYADLNHHNYELAIAQFTLFLERFPDSDLADDAQYGLGECTYARKEYAKAFEAFKKLKENYPESDRVPAALLRMGDTQIKLKRRRTGAKYLRELIKRFPDSEEAKVARKKLK